MFDSLELQAKLPRARVCAGPRLAKAIALAALVAALFAGAAAAQAHRLRPGVRSPAPSSRALSESLAQATGLTTSQVTAQDICPPARPGYARCAGQALVLRSSHALVRPHVRRQATFGRVKPAFVPGFVGPAGASASSPPLPGTPAYLQQAYDLSYQSQTGGLGDTVAIIDAFDAPTAESDLGKYRSKYGLPPCTAANGCFRQVNQSGAFSPLPTNNRAWEQEASLDMDAVSSLCPNCHILLVEANSASLSDLNQAMATAASMGANQISDSWSASSSGLLGGRWVFPGIATIAATGDVGYAGTSTDNYPAAFSGVTAAGGTSLTSAASPRGFSEGAWSMSGGAGGGSGCDLNVVKPSYQTDTGCAQQASGRTYGRAYADVSADADPATGLSYYDTAQGGWGVIGGTSLATPLIAAYYAITGVTTGTAQWAYNDSALLNDPASGSTGTCAASIRYICNAGIGYDGPTGAGSISGAVATAAPGIGGPAIGSGAGNTYTQSTRSHGATLQAGIYPNGLDTSWWIEYGVDTSYGQQTSHTAAGSGTSPKLATGYLSHLNPAATYHYRLVAQNSRGTTYGYDYTFTTPQASPSDPTAAFASPTAATPNSPVSFDASTSSDAGDTIVSYAWDFGDGQTSPPTPSAAINHPYPSPGTYYVTVIVTNSDGHSDSTTQPITVDQPQASFTAPQTIIAPNALASFDASGSTDLVGQITDYSWDFGDGSTADAGSSTSMTHVYTNRGRYVVKLTITNNSGQTALAQHTVTVDSAPTAAFSPPTGIQPTGSPLGFDATASTAAAGGTIADYSWNFGDGSAVTDTGTTPTAAHSYASPGVYTIALTVTDDLGMTNTSSQTVTVDHPQPAFTTSQTPIAPGADATFDASTSTDPHGSITDYSWNFGDGSSTDAGTSPTVDHTYAARGSYPVMLTITNNSTQSDSTQHTVTVDTPPTAAFSPSASVTTPGSQLNFDATASTAMTGGAISTYNWNFGDGSTDSGVTSSHTYAVPGVYTVALTVKDDLGIINTTTRTVTIDQPAASFTPPQTLPAPGSQATFDASGSTDPAATIIDYSWNFGDGSSTDAGTSPTVDHTYGARGPYTVTLTITNDNGQTNSTHQTITIDTPPTPAFSPSASVQTPGSQLSFDASGSASPDGGTIAAYSWDFGDGSTGTGATPSHLYPAAGVYHVTLTVKDDLGVTSTIAHTVTIDQPAASFTPPQTLTAPRSPASFDASSSTDPAGQITDYGWSFGDGSIGTGPTPTHSYANRGPYTVTLTITNNSGQTASTQHTITVDTPPTAAFNPPGTQAPNSKVSFDGTASDAPGGTIAAYSWDFGDGSTGGGSKPNHLYSSPGRYTVTLSVTDELGVSSPTTTQAVTVDAAPTAAFSASPNPASPGPAVRFDGGSSGDTLGTIKAYSWDFGDNATGAGATASHAYATPGRYTVSLTVTNDAGQTSTTSRSITVDAAPSALFSVSPSAARTGSPVSFNGGSSNDPVGTITGYSWNFGDGATASGPSASHTYLSAGTYEVALTVTNDAGQSTTSSHTVAVYAAPSALFSVSPATTLPRTAVSFNAGSSSDAGGTITGYNWNFGDGGTASGPSPSHAYTGPGAYTVTLTVTGSLGLATSSSHTVTVNPPPLSAQLSSAKRQKRSAVIKHGLSLTVSTNAVAKASFIVTMPVHATRRGRKHAKHGSRSTTSTLLRTSARSFAPGSHGVTLKLSRAAAGKLHAGTGTVLTVQLTLTDVYGRKLTRSARVTISS